MGSAEPRPAAERAAASSPFDDSAAAAERHRWRLALGALFVVALALRAAYLLEIADLPTFHHLVMDAATFDRQARAIAAGAWLPSHPFTVAPLYPYVLAVLYRLAPGTGFEAVRIVQTLLGAATPVLLALATALPFGRRAGLAAGLLAAFYGPLVSFTPLLLKETLAVLFLAGALVCLALLWRGRGGWGAALGAGALLGAAMQLRENLVVVLAAAVVAAAALAPRRAPAVLGIALGGILALAPVAWMNARAGGAWVLTTHSGTVFFIGNVLSESGTYQPLSRGSQTVEAEAEDARRLAAAYLTARARWPVDPASLSDAAVSRVLWRESWRAIAADPAAWLRRIGRKLRLFWADYELPDGEGYVLYRQLSAVLRLAPVTFASLLGLAAVGLLPAWRRDPRTTALLLVLSSAAMLSVVAFFVFARYRLPLVPLLLPVAGVGAAELLRPALGRRWRGLALAGLAGVAVALASYVHPLPRAARGGYESVLWYNLAGAGDRWAGDLLDRASAAGEGATRARYAADAARQAASAVAFAGEAMRLTPPFPALLVERAVALQRWASALLLLGEPRLAAERYAAAVADLDRAVASPAAAGDLELRAQIQRLRATVVHNLSLARRRVRVGSP